ncbi:glycoside hydrolase family 26 protein [Cellulomonas marina]|uniref:glycoside hydrolase family 26 protein n=1 Tax=Cellulomonas marina TaxID=988821 RepID=UPI0015872049|nr:glycosyl hydrolase [Cellulomonas marina]GIG29380.1 hypothetical protein Cma02nite_19800 [Cellulomonas marina]
MVESGRRRWTALVVGVLVTGLVGPVGVAQAGVDVTAAGTTSGAAGAIVAEGSLCPPGTVAVRTAARPAFGTTVPWGPLDARALGATETLVGRHVQYVHWYTGLGELPDPAKLQAVVDHGSVPVITWEPWVWTGGVDQPAYRLTEIAGGRWDAQLAAFADVLARWGGPVQVRWGHEMNGDWYPWGTGVNANAAGDYVRAYRHVHDVLTARGARQVTWVWSPNVVYPGSTPLAGLYPGDAYVDVVAVDGYNWGTSAPGKRWQTPAEVFDETLAQVRAVAPTKPLMIAETASTELGGDKAAWVRALFAWADAQPGLLAVAWFDEDKETDWRIASSRASVAAFREALAPR